VKMTGRTVETCNRLPTAWNFI